MTRQFAIIAGWILIVLGILNFFFPPLKVWPVHAILHLVVGVVGIWSANNPGLSQKFAVWVGLGGLALALTGFFGLKSIFGLIDLTPLFNVIHFVIGVWGSWAGFGNIKKATPTAA